MQARQTLLAIKIHCAGGCSPRNVINTANNYALKGKFIAENKKSHSLQSNFCFDDDPQIKIADIENFQLIENRIEG